MVPKECIKAVGKKLYQYTAIDECTRWSYRWITEEHSNYSSTLFIKKLQKVFPYEIQCIQTDNGTEFTTWHTKKDNRLSMFEKYLKSQGILHKLIRPAMPRHNGKVERQHRTDGERFYRNRTFYSVKDANEQLKHYQRFANMAPRQVFNWISANDRLLDFLLVV